MQQSVDNPKENSEGYADPVGRSLVEDLETLATYYCGRGEAGPSAAHSELQFATGLIRYRFAPPLGSILRTRGHVMVFGGAGAGKSTTSNIVSGTNVAEVNAQAGYTRHPTAIYVPADSRETGEWPNRIGPLSRVDRPSAGSLDEDRFSTRVAPSDCADPEFLQSIVVWDCPDITTRDATHYATRVVEISALADLCIYVASDERYNDELPTEFLQMVLSAGKPTVVVLTKMSEFDTDEFVAMFREQVLSRAPRKEGVRAIVPIPTPMRGKVSELPSANFPYGEHLRSLVRGTLADLASCRQASERESVRYLAERQNALLEPLNYDLGQWRIWCELVRRGANSAIARYEKEYLDLAPGEDFAQSHDALLRMLVPSGRVQHLWTTLEYLRVPYRMVKALAKKFTDRQTASLVDESQLLNSVREQYVDSLVVAVATRRASHPFWEAVHADMQRLGDLPIESIFHEHRTKQVRELRVRSREAASRLEDRLASSKWLVPTSRAIRLGLDGAVIGLVFYFGWVWLEGWSFWILAMVLVAVGVVDEFAKLVCHEIVRRQREELVARQRENVRELFRVAYVDVLARLPKGLGDRLEDLSELCHRIPESIRSLSARVGSRPAILSAPTPTSEGSP